MMLEGLIVWVFIMLLLGATPAFMVYVAMVGLYPLQQAARRREAGVQFRLLDLFCLFLWIQAPMALTHGLLSIPPEARWICDFLVWAALGTLWWFSVQWLSRAGVTSWKQRGVMLVFVIPLTVLAVIAIPGLFASFIVQVSACDILALGVLLGVGAVIVLAHLAARLSRRIIAAAAGEWESCHPPKHGPAADAVDRTATPAEGVDENPSPLAPPILWTPGQRRIVATCFCLSVTFFVGLNVGGITGALGTPAVVAILFGTGYAAASVAARLSRPANESGNGAGNEPYDTPQPVTDECTSQPEGEGLPG